MRKTLLLISSFLFLSILFFVCKSTNRIEEDEFVKIYSNLLVIKEIYRGDNKSYINARDSLYKAFKVNQIQIDNTLEYYNNDPERWKKFYSKVIEHLESNQVNIRMLN